MFSHIVIGITDFERALAFYRALMPVLEITERFCDAARPWAGWQSEPGPRPLFVIAKPYDKQSHQAGNGQMVAFLAKDREMVSRSHEAALANGATCEGSPGLRREYHEHYFGAYFRDTEGNKICVVCHSAPD